MEIIKVVAILLFHIFVSNANSEDFISGEVLKLLEKVALKVETLEKVSICAFVSNSETDFVLNFLGNY